MDDRTTPPRPSPFLRNGEKKKNDKVDFSTLFIDVQYLRLFSEHTAEIADLIRAKYNLPPPSDPGGL